MSPLHQCLSFVVSCFSDDSRFVSTTLDVRTERQTAALSWVASGLFISIYSVAFALNLVVYCRRFSLPRRGFRIVKSTTESWEDETFAEDFSTVSNTQGGGKRIPNYHLVGKYCVLVGENLFGLPVLVGKKICLLQIM